jgi:hypothetical protein
VLFYGVLLGGGGSGWEASGAAGGGCGAGGLVGLDRRMDEVRPDRGRRWWRGSFALGEVPAFPVKLQPPPPVPTVWQETLPLLLTTRTAVPAAQVPLTRFCNAALSRPSSWSAFRFFTFAVELTVNGLTPRRH